MFVYFTLFPILDSRTKILSMLAQQQNGRLPMHTSMTLPSTTAWKGIGKKKMWVNVYYEKGRAGGMRIKKTAKSTKSTIEPISFNFLFKWHTLKYAKSSNALAHGAFFLSLFSFLYQLSSASKMSLGYRFHLVVSFWATLFFSLRFWCSRFAMRWRCKSDKRPSEHIKCAHTHKIAVGLSFSVFVLWTSMSESIWFLFFLSSSYTIYNRVCL